LAPLIDRGRIRTNAWYTFEILPGTKKAVKVSFVDKATQSPVLDSTGKIFYAEGDYVVYAVGYEPINAGLAQGFALDAQFEPILSTIRPNDPRVQHAAEVVVGTRLVSPATGRAENIYAGGPSAGPIIHPDDPGGTSSVTINVFGPRSQSLGEWLREQYLRAKKERPDHP
jgi:hypothetical protein